MNQQTRNRWLWAEKITLAAFALVLLCDAFGLAPFPLWMHFLMPILGAGAVALLLWQRKFRQHPN